MRLPYPLFVFSLFALAAGTIIGFWWLLGQPIAMPPSPLAADQKIPCVSYAPFRRGQSPFTADISIPAAQIDDDLSRLSRVTGCVRIYAVDQGLENVPELARKHGLQVILGLWLGRDATSNAGQIAGGVRLANEYRDVVRMLVIGNEALLRGEISEADLGKILRDVRTQVSVPTTYADVWEFWIRHRGLAEFVDIVTVHILPYWEDEPVPASQAGEHIADIRRHVGEAFPGKPILIGETGWPSEGRMRWGARATPADQARVLHDVVALQNASGFDVNLIEAFDQPWKRLLEGTVGGYWGLLDADTREPKFAWGAEVSNHPAWREQAATGTAYSALLFAIAMLSSRRFGMPNRAWLTIACLAIVSGCSLGLAIHMQAVGSRTPGELLLAAIYLGTAVLVPLIAAAALARGEGRVSFAMLTRRGPVAAPGSRWLAGAAAVAAVLATFLALGLTFDPRYREFQTALLIGPVCGLLLAGHVPSGRANLASERVFAVLLLMLAVAVAVQERIENWEALAFAAVLVTLAAALAQAAPSRRAARQEPAR